ncbi:MAG TPA: hypothetical protein VNB22_09680 [Pyrinomonadaceae bacterium]|nr:hypothetical protein [Pyrinomonadaceae bacterium]
MKSQRGFFGAIIFLSVLPLAALGQMIFGIEAELIIHFVCAAGFALVSLAVFDFKIPALINWAGCLTAGALAVIFLLQGVSQLVQNDSLGYFVFQILGQRLEAVLVKLILLWFAALLIFDSRGKTRILGFVVMTVVLCTEIYSYYLAYTGSSSDTEAGILKLLYLLPFVWLIFESRKSGN